MLLEFSLLILIISLNIIILNTFQPSIANTTNIDTLLIASENNDKIVIPPESLQDKMAFIFNNLSQVNLQTKVN